VDDGEVTKIAEPTTKQERRRSRLATAQAWATVGATLFTGLAVLVSAASLSIQLSQLRADERRNEQANVSRVSWWIVPGSPGRPTYIINNASTTHLSFVRIEILSLRDMTGPVLAYAYLGDLEPCTRMSAEILLDSSGELKTAALAFFNSEGSWRIHGGGPERRDPRSLSVFQDATPRLETSNHSTRSIANCAG
jgi:hypothetical protein